ncbi:hypothetical protein [Henriciella sp.]|uniref:hypothetical protein n=1 Tax=Henriciella sp. TaxID=1968823 RepID=UPI000C10F082|nr:hypothetical protein [Henriciella sp.]PHR83093.1 MAG: hypothetical protein COA64_00110 [Henriciella sp.]
MNKFPDFPILLTPYALSPDGGVESSEMDSGLLRQYVRYPQMPTRATFKVFLENAEAEAELLAFYAENRASIFEIDLSLQTTGGTGLQTYSAQFLSAPTLETATPTAKFASVSIRIEQVTPLSAEETALRRSPWLMQRTATSFDIFRKEEVPGYYVRWRFVRTIDEAKNRSDNIVEDTRLCFRTEDGWIIGNQITVEGAHELAISELGKGDFVGTVHGNTLLRSEIVRLDDAPLTLDDMETGDILPASTITVEQFIDLYQYNTGTGASDPANYTGETRFGQVERLWLMKGRKGRLEQSCKTIAFTSRNYYLGMAPLNPDNFTQFSWSGDHSARFTLPAVGQPGGVIIAPAGTMGLRAYGLDGSVVEVIAVEGWPGSGSDGHYLSLERKSDGRAKLYFGMAGFGSSNTVEIEEGETKRLVVDYNISAAPPAEINIPGNYVLVASGVDMQMNRTSAGALVYDFTDTGWNPLLSGLSTAAIVRVRAADPVTINGELYWADGDFDLSGGVVTRRDFTVNPALVETQKPAALPLNSGYSSPLVKTDIYVKDRLPRIKLIDAVGAEYRTAGNGNMIINFAGSTVPADAGLVTGDVLAIVPAGLVTIGGVEYDLAGVYPAALVTDDEIYILAADLYGDAATIPAGSSFSDPVATSVLRDRPDFS